MLLPGREGHYPQFTERTRHGENHVITSFGHQWGRILNLHLELTSQEPFHESNYVSDLKQIVGTHCLKIHSFSSSLIMKIIRYNETQPWAAECSYFCREDKALNLN